MKTCLYCNIEMIKIEQHFKQSDNPDDIKIFKPEKHAGITIDDDSGTRTYTFYECKQCGLTMLFREDKK